MVFSLFVCCFYLKELRRRVLVMLILGFVKETDFSLPSLQWGKGVGGALTTGIIRSVSTAPTWSSQQLTARSANSSSPTTSISRLHRGKLRHISFTDMINGKDYYLTIFRYSWNVPWVVFVNCYT